MARHLQNAAVYGGIVVAGRARNSLQAERPEAESSLCFNLTACWSGDGTDEKLAANRGRVPEFPGGRYFAKGIAFINTPRHGGLIAPETSTANSGGPTRRRKS
jgi:hypothetical protein